MKPSVISSQVGEILEQVMTMVPGETRYFALPEGRFARAEVARRLSSYAGVLLGRGAYSSSTRDVPGKLRFTYLAPKTKET